MAKFLTFQFNGCRVGNKVLISPTLLKQMQTVQFRQDGQVAGYGLGVMVKPYHGTTLVHHSGGGYGYRAEQAWIPEAKIGIIILTNDGLGSSFTSDVYEYAMQAMLKAKVGSLPATQLQPVNKVIVHLDKAYLRTLTGSYKTNRRLITLIEHKGKLATVSGTDTVWLKAHSRAEFSATNGDRFFFFFSKAGKPTHYLNINQHDADFYIYNDSPTEKAGVIKSSWRGLVGIYKGYNNRQPETLRLFIKNGYLYCSSGGDTKVNEYQSGIFFTTDGESIIKKGNIIYWGNRAFRKQ
ncbi:serine hydrolase [Spirosoma foliorum]|uniref:Serine hydrolase n=2 Tax=Spirosoma foliorum TaxID=2710596 RepID=A0A7G5GUF5_9BACT|nr:serine hydrolase [Spirosoma foliorum]